MDVNCTVITGYHGTSSNYTESIEKHGLDPDKTHTIVNIYIILHQVLV